MKTNGEFADPGDNEEWRENEHRRLILTTSRENGSEIHLDFVGAKGKQGPRVAEIIIKHSPNLLYNDVIEGSAVNAANKQLIAQKKSNSELRIVILGQNVNTLDTGRLATIRFKRLNQDKARVEISTDKPIFAPSEANEGLLVSDPVEF